MVEDLDKKQNNFEKNARQRGSSVLSKLGEGFRFTIPGAQDAKDIPVFIINEPFEPVTLVASVKNYFERTG